MRDPRHRRRRLHRLPPVRPPAGRGPPRRLPGQLLHRPPREHRAPARPPRISSCSGTTSASRSSSRWTRSTTWPVPPRRCTTSTTRSRPSSRTSWARINMLVLAKRVRRADPPGLDLRGLRRPDGAPADRELLGQREPDRPARLLRRGQARRRDADDGLPPRRTGWTSGSPGSSTPTARAWPENDGRVVSNFIVQALRGQELTLYGTGEQTRSFCYVDDLVDGCPADERRGPARAGQPGQPGRVHHPRAGRGGGAGSCGGETRMVYRPLPQDDPTQRQPDITRAREWLGWEPTMQLAEGLAQTVAYFRAAAQAGTSVAPPALENRDSTGDRSLRCPAASRNCLRRATGPRPAHHSPPYGPSGTAFSMEPPMTPPSTARLLVLAARSPPASRCARNPVTGKNELSLVSEGQEIQMGKQAAQEVAQTIGFYNDPGCRPTSPSIGMRMAKRVRAAQPALGVPRGERRRGQRLRAARRVHLRHPRPHRPTSTTRPSWRRWWGTRSAT